MRKMIGKIMLGIITAVMMAGCEDESFQVRNSQTAEFSKFEYESRGAPWEVVYDLTIDFDKGVLITQESNSSKPKTKSISLKPEQIAELQNVLNSAGVTGWKDKYENRRGVCDGTFWDASYVLKDGTSRKIHGDNNWPSGIKTLSAALKKMGIEFIQ